MGPIPPASSEESRLSSLFARAAKALVLFFALGGAATAAPIGPLTLLTWADYIDPSVLADFEQESGIQVRVIVFADDQERDKRLVANGGGNYDVVCLNHSVVSSYVASGWLAPATVKEIPNLAHLESRWLARVPASRGYAVPYFWGATGLVYRRDLFGAELTSWKQIFEPEAAQRGKIAMIENARDLVGAALKALGYSINSTVQTELAEAEALLMKQRPAVASYTYDLAADRKESGLYKGTASAAMAFNGDADLLAEIEPRASFVLPREGGILWLDFLGVLEQSRHKPEAYALLDFLNRPEIAARNALFVHFASPNAAALRHLPQDFLSNHTIFPTPAEVDRSEFEAEVPPRIQKRINEIAARVRR